MEQKYVGLDIGGSSIKALILVKNPNDILLTNVYIEHLPPNVIVDKEIMNYAVISNIVKNIMSNAEFKDALLNVSINSYMGICKRVTVPYVNRKTIAMDALLFMNQYVGVAPETYTADIKLISINDAKERAEIIYAAVKNETLSDYMSIMDSAEQKVNIINISTMAICELYTLLEYPIDSTSVILDLAHEYTEIIFLKKGIFDYSFHSNVSGKSLTDTLARKTTIPMESIDAIKANPHASPAKDTVLDVINKDFLFFLEKDIGQAIDEYISWGGVKPSRFYLSGGGANTPGLVERLQKTYNTEVKVMKVDTKIKVVDPQAMEVLETKPAILNTAIAMALR